MSDMFLDPGNGDYGSSDPVVTPVTPDPIFSIITDQIDPNTGAPADAPPATPIEYDTVNYTPTVPVYGPPEPFGPPAPASKPTPSASTDNTYSQSPTYSDSYSSVVASPQPTPVPAATIAAPGDSAPIARTVPADPLGDAIKSGSSSGGGGGGAAMPSIPSAVVSTSPGGGGSTAGLLFITVGGGILAIYLYNKYAKHHKKAAEE